MGVVLLTQEVVTKGRHMGQSVEDHVHIIIGFDIVETHYSWKILGPIQCDREFGGMIQGGNVLHSEDRPQHIL